MLFSDRSRSNYRNAPIHEVICQLRFPTILTINSVEPADFQEAIRDAFPQYARRQDIAAPKIPVWAAPIPRWNSNLL
ncbi:MAG: TIGR04255 family protein [Dysosmobacter sp.]